MIRCRCCDEPAAPFGDAVAGEGKTEVRFPLCPFCGAWVRDLLDDLRALPVTTKRACPKETA